jgi:hypothetical protein
MKPREGVKMFNYKITRDGKIDLKFTGEMIAHAENSPDTARSNYSGSTGRWTELVLYKTKGGKFVCSRIHGTQWQGERDSHEAVVCETEQQVVGFFGVDKLAKELYDDAKIDAAEEVE